MKTLSCVRRANGGDGGVTRVATAAATAAAGVATAAPDAAVRWPLAAVAGAAAASASKNHTGASHEQSIVPRLAAHDSNRAPV